MCKLTNNVSPKTQGEQLTKNRELPFIISFKDKLPEKYNFSSIKENDIKNFQRFLNKVSNMTISQVDKLYLRDPDKNDKYNGEQVQHYEVTQKFRIHGIFQDKHFMVLRIDSNHRFHNG